MSLFPAAASVPVNIYKIPLMCLVGQIASDRSIAPPPSPQPQPQSLLSPLVSSGDSLRPKSPLPSCKRSPLLRTKKLGTFNYGPHEVCAADEGWPETEDCDLVQVQVDLVQ